MVVVQMGRKKVYHGSFLDFSFRGLVINHRQSISEN